MTSFLIKLFVRDSENVKDTAVRIRYGVFSGTVGIIANVILCALKIIAGAITGSVSVIADAINNLSDAASSIISLIGFKMSGKPADKDHPFGHGRIEYISALIVSMAILLMGFELVKTSFSKLFSPTPLTFNALTAVILGVSVIIKLWLFFFNRTLSKRTKSDSMRATAMDSLSDSVATLAVFLGLLFFKFTGINIDAYMGILVSCFIFYAGYSTIKDSLAPLLGEAATKELADEIEQIVLSHNSVLGIHDLIIHNYGVGRFMLSLHAEVSADSDILAVHDEIDLIEKQLAEHFNCQAVIHMDPIITNDEMINAEKQFVISTVQSIDPALSIHDFRMVAGPTHTNLIFDLVIPFDFHLSDKDVLNTLKTLVTEHNPTHYLVVNVDKSFIGTNE